jgi:dienelactone hydrolase
MQTLSADGFVADLFGGLVPSAGDETETTSVRLMHRLSRGDESTLDNWRISSCGVSWTLFVCWPAAPPSKDTAQLPILLTGDACWPHVVDPVAISRVAAPERVALAWFNRLELAFDGDAERAGPLFERFPGATFGCISAWAWGLSRCVDALNLIAASPRIGVIGHSRGGKSALLAGASDARIAAVISHNSGTGGAASLTVVGQGSESLEALARRFPHWLGPSARDPDVQRRIASRDSFELLKCIAPRALLVIQAADDLWANPLGTRANVRRLEAVWRAADADADASSRLQLLERAGVHAMSIADWQSAISFLQQQQR